MSRIELLDDGATPDGPDELGLRPRSRGGRGGGPRR
jgi:hypothetical protein